MDRRTFLSLCGLAGAQLACGDGREAPSPDGAGPAAGTLPVPPLDEGEVVDGVRVFRLEARTGAVSFVGPATATYGYNGSYLGPTLRFRRGERVRLEVTNRLPEPTTLHSHGLHAPARADGGPHQPIAPGATWIAELDVIQRGATCWYHPHPMHDTARQVYMGLAGLIAIEEAAPAAGLPSTYGVDDLPLVLQDRRFAADGTHPYSTAGAIAMHDMMAGVKGETMLVNGAVTPHAIVPRGLVRLRILNGSNARTYHLGFADGRRFLQIASDGGLLAAPVETARMLLSPGERAELLVDFGADPVGGVTALRSYSGEVFARLFPQPMLADALDRTTFDLMSFEAGPELAAITEPVTAFEPIPPIAASAAARSRDLVLSMQAGQVLINGARMTDLDAVPAAINFQIPAGDVELWTITNTSGMPHPFHVHNRQFQVLDLDGGAPPPALAGWKDTVLVEPGAVVRLLVPFDGTPDLEMPFMFHCHILEHEDHGMMGQFFLV